MSLEAFTRQYIETALWSTNDESTPQGGEPLDRNYGAEDIAAKSLRHMRNDCRRFYDSHGDLFDDDEQAGHDFWLTRNGHGAGFWDGDWPEPAATVLTEACKTFGECDLYVGDDGLIYLMGAE